MIPWFQSTVIQIGPLSIRTWGMMVAIGFLFGAWLAAKRAKSKNLNPSHVWDMAFWIFVSAFIGARLFHTFFYEPALLGNLWELIDPRRPGFAILGGFLGAAGAFAAYIKIKKLKFFEYADVMVWGLPWGVAIGRIGCFLIHDHPGTLSSFVLAVNYPGGTRHDLGLYLSLAGVVMGIIFLILDKKSRKPGFYFGAWIAMEAVSRIWLDFYRVADVRWGSLTPTQWIVIPVGLLGILLMYRASNRKKLTMAPS